MKRSQRNKSRNQEEIRGLLESSDIDSISPAPIPKSTTPLRPLNKSQERLFRLIQEKDLIFVAGCAGTGKTWCAAAMAAQELMNKRISKLIVTRPAVEVDDEDMGALPGELEEKFAPWFEPFRDVLEERLGTSTLKYHQKRENILASPLAYMRGKSFKNAWVILDEAQNTSVAQMKMFLTRLGEGSKMIVLGDTKQSDRRGTSGLADAIARFRDLPEVGIHEFTLDDVVRHGLVKKILERYED